MFFIGFVSGWFLYECWMVFRGIPFLSCGRGLGEVKGNFIVLLADGCVIFL